MIIPKEIWFSKNKTVNIICFGNYPGGGLNLDQTDMCHRRLKFITLFWSGKTQKGYPALELPLLPQIHCIVLYCIVLYCIVLYCIVLYRIVLHCIVLETKIMFMLYLVNQMILPFPFSSVMFVQKSFKFSITVISLSYDICSAFQD